MTRPLFRRSCRTFALWMAVSAFIAAGAVQLLLTQKAHWTTWLVLTAPIAAGVIGWAIWKPIAEKAGFRAIVTAVIASIFAYPLAFWFLIAGNFIHYQLFEEPLSARDAPVGPLYGIVGAFAFSLWGWALSGWFVVPFAALCGWVYDWITSSLGWIASTAIKAQLATHSSARPSGPLPPGPFSSARSNAKITHKPY